MKARIRKASDLISEISGGGIGKRLSRPASVASSWRAAAGDAIFEHSKIFDIANGKIVVLVSHPGWRQQILLKKKRIIKMMSADFPELKIRDIAFKE